MKARLLVFCLLGVGAGCASVPTQTTTGPNQPAKTTAGQPGSDNQQAARLLTGSFIPRPVDVNGCITDGPSPLLVIDRDAIERSGASDLSDLLKRGGWQH